MAKEMLINVSEGEECRIALISDGALEELYMERTSSTSHVGNVYKGKVMNVEASIQAAFVDFGLGRNGFLHISDLLPSYFGRKREDVHEFVGKKMARRDRPPIQRCLRRGDEIIVQVIKEGIGTKGPTLSSYLSISGKMLVMMPGVSGRGVSRKIEDDDERRRLKQILEQLDPPDDCGFIIRTESVGKSKTEIERDLKYLARLWEQIKKRRDSEAAPVELYTEGDLVTRTVRDVFSSDVDQIVIDNKEVARRVKDVIKLSNPRAKNKVELYEEPIPLFHKYGIEREIEQMYSRHVPLRSGGSLVIDSTEAIVAIDVNSGKNRENNDAEMTAFRTDMEAADEICRQLKLRDLGGVIICDFIDLRYERHRRELEQRLHDNLKRDRAKTKVLRMSQFGIIEMTRQRMRPSLKRSVYFDCPHCKGAGLVKTPESMCLDVMRRLAIAIHDARVVRVELSVNPDVSFHLLNKKRRALAQLEDSTAKRIVIRTDASIGLDEMRLSLFDNREGLVVVNELASATLAVPHTSQLRTRQPMPPQRGRPAPGRGDDRQHGRQDNRDRRPEPQEVDAFEDRADEYDSEQEGADEQDTERGLEPRQQQGRDRGHAAPAHTDSAGRNGYDDGSGGEGEGGGRRRRRRRRRGRGRGRGGQGGFNESTDNRAPAGRDDRSAQSPAGREEGEFDTFDRDETDPARRQRDLAEDADADREESLEDRAVPRPLGDDSDREDEFESDRERTRAEERDSGERDEFDDRFQRDDSTERAGADERERLEDRDALDEEVVAEERDDDRDLVASEDVDTGQTEVEPAALAPKKARPPRGRGRARAKKPEPAEPSSEANEPAEPLDQPLDESIEKTPAGKPKRRRGTRGGRGRRKKPSSAATSEALSGEDGAEKTGKAKAAPAPESTSSATTETPIVRTGSTDRHLEDEEPVLHEPVRRPRSYRDLDQIPDDYE